MISFDETLVRFVVRSPLRIFLISKAKRLEDGPEPLIERGGLGHVSPAWLAANDCLSA